MTKGVGAFFRSLLEGPFGGEGDKNACRPLPIPANPGFAISVNANSSSPSDSMKFEGGLRGLVIHFQPAIATTGGDVPATADLKGLTGSHLIIGRPFKPGCPSGAKALVF